MMRGPITFSGLYGETATYEFHPPYELENWIAMQGILEDATMRGVVAVRFIHDQEVRIIVTNGAING